MDNDGALTPQYRMAGYRYTDECGRLMIKGVVLAYCNDASGGVISTSDGKRMFFHRKDWMSDTSPCTGQNVLLKHNPDGTLQVYFESDARMISRRA